MSSLTRKILRIFKKEGGPTATDSKSKEKFLNHKYDLHNYYDMYLKNSYINRAVSLIANNVASYDFEFKNESEVLTKFFDNPNERQSWHVFIENLVNNFLIFGNAFVYLEKKENERFVMNNINNKNILVGLNEKGQIEYKYCNEKKGNDLNFPFIFHLKNYNPSSDIFGVSVLESLQNAATLYHDIDVNNLAILTNGGRSPGILSIKNKANVTAEDMESLYESVVSKVKGTAQAAGAVTIVNADVEWIHTGYSSKDMGYVDSAKRAIKAIAVAFGVPLVLLGESAEGENSRTNVEFLMKSFEQQTILPLMRKIFDFLNEIVKVLDGENKIKFISKKNSVNEG